MSLPLGTPCSPYAVAKLPLSVEDLLIDLYYYFDKSSKRNKQLKQLQQLCDIETRGIIKHVNTRWLSVGKCLDRLLEQWPALLKFFTSKDSPSSSVTKGSSGAHPGGPDKKAQPHSDRPHERAQSSSAQQPTVTAQLKQSQVHKKPGPKQMPSISGKLVHTSIPTKQKVCSKESSAKAQEEGHCQKLKRPSSDSQKKSLSTSGKTKPRESMPLSTKQDRIKSCFERASTKLYCLFLQASIPAFDKLNLLLQSDKPNIHVLGRELQPIYTGLLCKFVKPAVLVAASSVYTVDFRSLNNQKSENDLVIGTKTRQYLHACIADKSLQHEDVKLFYSSVKAYFSEACTYMQKKFPFQDELLRNAQVADISQRGEGVI
ncbi:toll-like receptor 6 [Huso huso]|uniref:Toll-like receptor 6 n=1 Tax=Huso huso TaxID=61971 RepID=A0ABR1A3B9_HUSHU